MVVNLNVDIEKLVEAEIRRQVKEAVSSKMKDLTLRKLGSMGYDLKYVIEKVIREEVRSQLNIKDFIGDISKKEILNTSSELIKEELFDIINSRNENRW